MSMSRVTREFLFGNTEPQFSHCSYLGRGRVNDMHYDMEVDTYVVVREGEARWLRVPDGDEGDAVEMTEGKEFQIELEDHRRCDHSGRRFRVKLVEISRRLGSVEQQRDIIDREFGAGDDSPPLVHRMAIALVIGFFPEWESVEPRES